MSSGRKNIQEYSQKILKKIFENVKVMKEFST